MGAGRDKEEAGINKDTLLYTKKVNNKDPLQSPGNYTQHLIITCNEKAFEKAYTHTHTPPYIELSHGAGHLKLTRHGKSTVLQLKEKKEDNQE